MPEDGLNLTGDTEDGDASTLYRCRPGGLDDQSNAGRVDELARLEVEQQMRVVVLLHRLLHLGSRVEAITRTGTNIL